ncbi:MAG: DUF5686 family protein, partial [Flavobacteriales bacterium]
ERVLQGRVTDGQGNPLPYVNVFFKPFGQKGTTTNEEGRFELKVEKGEADSILFRYTGYQEKSFPLSQVESPLHVSLRKREIKTKTTVVSGDKDPGERIMDSVRAHRDDYLDGLGGYGAKFYMKGKARLDSISGNNPVDFQVNGQEADSARLLYLTESISRFRYYPPDRIREEMISSRVSGDPRAFSSNRAKDILKNPYVHRIELSGVSKRAFISPLSRSAPTYYEFDWEGAYHKNGKTISKIRVVPKRDHDPVFKGVVEVVEGDWRLKALDLKVPASAPLEFVDSLRVKQEYVNWKGQEWLPLSLEESYWFNIFGISATYKMVGHCEAHKKLDSSNEAESKMLFRVRDSARKKDSGYWQNERSYVLKEKERSHYKKADSLQRVHNSKPYLDSIDSVNNRLTMQEFLLGGYEHDNSIDSVEWGVNSLLSAIG